MTARFPMPWYVVDPITRRVVSRHHAIDYATRAAARLSTSLVTFTVVHADAWRRLLAEGGGN